MGDREKAARKAREEAVEHGVSLDGRGGYRRHVLVCAGSKCCDEREGKATWKHLSERVKELGRDGVPVYRTRVDCLKLCTSGPLVVVYPEGTWYHSVTPEVADRIVDEHPRHGRVVDEHAFASNPMTGAGEA